MAKVRMYMSARCPYCSHAEGMLRDQGVDEIDKIHVDHDEETRKQMELKIGKQQLPQFIINDRHIGGFDELAKLKHSGELKALLAA